MKRTAARSGATIAIVAVAIGVAGCSSSPSSNNAASTTTAAGSPATSATSAKPQSKVAKALATKPEDEAKPSETKSGETVPVSEKDVEKKP